MRVPVSTSSNSAEATNGTRGMRLRSCSICVALRKNRQEANRHFCLAELLAELLDSLGIRGNIACFQFSPRKLKPARNLGLRVPCQLLNTCAGQRIYSPASAVDAREAARFTLGRSSVPARNHRSTYPDCRTQPFAVLGIFS